MVDILSRGLSSDQVRDRLKQYGLNEITVAEKKNLLFQLLSQFNNFLIILLIAAAVVSFALGEYLDGVFILVVVILNALFGLYQEYKAERSLDLLKKMTVVKTRVIRDGREQEIDSKYLVPGDVIHVEEGTKIPADARLIMSWHLEVDEASLTGESLPVPKNEGDFKNNLIYLGTVVARGRAYAVVEKTGRNTRFGKIAETLSEIKEEPTPLQRKLALFTKQIGTIGIIASFSVFSLSFIQNKNFFESFLFAVSLAVAAVPEGLPAVMTITFAIGVDRMAKKKAIIRRLMAIETLGSVTLVATDKTGTLTTNQMMVKKIWVENHLYGIDNLPSISNHHFSKMILNGILCSTASLAFRVDGGKPDVIGDTTEGAILLLAQKVGLLPDMVKREWQTIDEISFNPVTKRMTVVVKKKDEIFVFTKGAPESILSVCNKILIGNRGIEIEDVQKSKIETEFRNFARSGLRMIAFSFKKVDSTTDQKQLESDQTFLGFVGIADPVRQEAIESVQKAKEAGIKVVMITGDNELTAEAIGIETGIISKGENILTGGQLDSVSDSELLQILSRTKIFARVSPEHKYRLVKLYQRQGEIVAVTGDGVNDALALKQAEVGVAMGISGTDVAKETADMIITDDNFTSLVNAIEEGRDIFDSIKNAIKYLLSCNIAEVIAVTISVTLGLPLIVTALQILYINLITDGMPALSLAFSPKEPNIMRRSPRRTMAILEKSDYRYMFLIGFFGAVLTVVSFIIGLSVDGIELARTMAFTTLALIQPLILIDLWLSHRIIHRSLSLLKHPVFLVALILPFILQPILIYHPFFQEIFKTQSLPLGYLLASFLFALLILIPIEMRKFIALFRILSPKS